jgi:hypothetical protein
VRYSRLVPFDDDRGEVVIGLGLEQVGLDDGSWRHHADDLTLDDALAGLGLARLLADSDLVALVDQPRQVAVERVVGDPGHGVALALAHLP